MIKPLRQLLLSYKEANRALPSFNIDTFAVYQAIEDAVAISKLPCLVQLSAGEDQFVQAERLFMLVKKAQADGLPIYLNMDHCHDLPRMKKLLQLGFDMVHFDGSALPFNENLQQSQDLLTFLQTTYPDAETRPLLEVEFNKINLVEHGIDPESLTTPEQASTFLQQAPADLLAISVGNLHGVPTSGLAEHIDLDLFQKIISACPTSTLFTMHGGSGLDPNELKKSIGLGVVKININTDLRLAYHSELKHQLEIQSTQKMYDYYKPVITKMREIATQKLLQFYG